MRRRRKSIRRNDGECKGKMKVKEREKKRE